MSYTVYFIGYILPTKICKYCRPHGTRECQNKPKFQIRRNILNRYIFEVLFRFQVRWILPRCLCPKLWYCLKIVSKRNRRANWTMRSRTSISWSPIIQVRFLISSFSFNFYHPMPYNCSSPASIHKLWALCGGRRVLPCLTTLPNDATPSNGILWPEHYQSSTRSVLLPRQTRSSTASSCRECLQGWNWTYQWNKRRLKTRSNGYGSGNCSQKQHKLSVYRL